MGLLIFSINVTLDGCVDHQEGIADDETHAYFTRLMDDGGAMLWGRVTYEMMEGYWPAVARGDVEAPPAIREWAVEQSARLRGCNGLQPAGRGMKKPWREGNGRQVGGSVPRQPGHGGLATGAEAPLRALKLRPRWRSRAGP